MITIYFEDSHLLVAEKPPGMPVQSDPTGDPDLLTILSEQIHQPLWLVHRLDRPVGGLLVYAKTKEACARLSTAWQEKRIQKSYTAVVCGTPKKEEDECKHYIRKCKTINRSKIEATRVAYAKRAVLRYRVLDRCHSDEFGPLALVHVDLETGRHHQIRVQLSHIGLPIWGDTKYNKVFTKRKVWSQIALWSTQLRFEHPMTKIPLEFSISPMIEPFTSFKENDQ
jgi:23S rRNA pseudouridine1911/1915/1917 synthase